MLAVRDRHEQRTAEDHWRSACLPGLLYPGLIARLNEVAPGRVYTDLTWAEWAMLDAFEDPTYALTAVRLRPTNGTALAYVWTEATNGTVWQSDSLTSRELAEYLARCARWRKAHEATASQHRA
ncbi:gamma-glutamylcyclotransferase family protein [Pseudonocardia sp. Cha107L01]|uniref:gamma-glutamylcyclotransferase family protein n=1 Tax=Pseudonocardia sp. Cha107L01 TaxID=3457576 RepID=UPI00403EA3B7